MINAIFAHDSNYGIGKSGNLPWPHNAYDMKWFSDNTKNGVVIMGRKTWQSLGNQPLKNRINIVLTRDSSSIAGTPDMVVSATSTTIFESIMSISENYASRKLWIIGGADIYSQAIPYCDYLYITKFADAYDCDTFIDRNLLKSFNKLSSKSVNNCDFSIWGR